MLLLEAEGGVRKPALTLYSLECAEGKFSEVQIHDPEYPGL
jgi:hypothetical protein